MKIYEVKYLEGDCRGLGLTCQINDKTDISEFYII